MQTRPRDGASIDKICVHTNEGPQSMNGASGLASYLQRIDGGYHAIADSANLVTTADDQTIVWGAGGLNTHAIHICLIGYAHQSPQDWDDAYARGEFVEAARWVAAKAIQYGIPITHLTPDQVATSGVRGICGHGDVHAPASMGHYDPGPNFPWTAFLPRVAELVAETTGGIAIPDSAVVPPPTTPKPQEELTLILQPGRKRDKKFPGPAAAVLDVPSKSVLLYNGARVAGDRYVKAWNLHYWLVVDKDGVPVPSERGVVGIREVKGGLMVFDSTGKAYFATWA